VLFRSDALATSQVRPGGVGYGLFYTAAFKRAFALGTAIQFEVICRTRRAGTSTPGSTSRWQLLSKAHGYVRTDNKGFHLVFLDRDYAFAVDS